MKWNWLLFLKGSLNLLMIFLVKANNEGKDHDHRPWCTPDNLSFRTMSNISTLFLQGDGSFTFGYHHCRIRNFEGRHFRDVHNALKRNHIFFFGDSLTRYTYMSLAHFLVHRRWPSSYPQYDPEGLSVCSEFQFRSWSKFYPWTNQRLTSLHKEIDRTDLQRHPFAGVEVCDCKRKDDDMMYPGNSENRFLRVVPAASNLACKEEHNDNDNKRTMCILEGDFSNTKDDMRLSHMQWWGKNPVRAHKQLASVPRSNEFLNFVDEVNKLYCGGNPSATLIPGTGSCEISRLFNINLPHEAFDFPHFPNETTSESEFLAEVLSAMNATHILANTGYWMPLVHFSPSFLPSMIEASRNHLSARDRNPELRMKPFMFRETYESSVPTRFYTPNDYESDHQALVDFMKDGQYQEDVEVMWGRGLTTWIANWFHVRHTDGAANQLGWENVVLSVDYLRRKGLLSWVRSNSSATQFPQAAFWTDEPPSLEEQFADKYRGIPAQSDLGKEIIDNHMNFQEDVRYIFEDIIHFAPYVYNEINKVFLSTVAPHLIDDRQIKSKGREKY